jgi:hypothetical protein
MFQVCYIRYSRYVSSLLHTLLLICFKFVTYATPDMFQVCYIRYSRYVSSLLHMLLPICFKFVTYATPDMFQVCYIRYSRYVSSLLHTLLPICFKFFVTGWLRFLSVCWRIVLWYAIIMVQFCFIVLGISFDASGHLSYLLQHTVRDRSFRGCLSRNLNDDAA